MFWSGGIANPLEVIEQITYLLFIRGLSDVHTLEGNRANTTRKPMRRRIFPEGKDDENRSRDDLRWSRLKHLDAKKLYATVAGRVFPFIQTLGGDASASRWFADIVTFRRPPAVVFDAATLPSGRSARC